MADYTPSIPSNAGALAPFSASEPAGDAIIYGGGDVLIEFDNGHSSSITVNFAPTQATIKVQGAGRVAVPTRSLVMAAGTKGVFKFAAEDINSYINAAGKLPITYTGGNAAMLLRSMRV